MLWSSRFVPAGDGETGTGEFDCVRQQQADFGATGRQQHFRTWLEQSPTARGSAEHVPLDAPLPSKTLSSASILVHRLGVFRSRRIIASKGRSYNNRCR